MKNCKVWKKKIVRRQSTFWPFRTRGGAGKSDDDDCVGNLFAIESVSPIVDIAIKNAKAHGINLRHGVKSLGNGDCAFESVIDSINTRSCFEEYLEGSPGYWREIWMSEIQKIAYDEWNCGLSKQQWKEGFDILKQSGTYELDLGDLVPAGIAHCTKKNLLIFNTSASAQSLIYVIPASTFGGKADTDIPVCLAYNQYHYEPLVPCDKIDIDRTVNLTKQYLDGHYEKDVFLEKFKDNQKETYDENFPPLNSSRTKLKVNIVKDGLSTIKDNFKKAPKIKEGFIEEDSMRLNKEP